MHKNVILVTFSKTC